MPSPALTPRPDFDGRRRSESGAGHADATHEAATLGCRMAVRPSQACGRRLRIPLRGASVHSSSRHAAEKAAHPPSCGRSLLSRCGGSCLRSAGGVPASFVVAGDWRLSVPQNVGTAYGSEPHPSFNATRHLHAGCIAACRVAVGNRRPIRRTRVAGRMVMCVGHLTGSALEYARGWEYPAYRTPFAFVARSGGHPQHGIFRFESGRRHGVGVA